MPSTWISSGTSVRSRAISRGDERTHRVGGPRELARRRGRQAHRLGKEAREHGLVDARDLEQIRHQVAAVDHLACEGLLDLSHARDLTLNNE